MRNSRSLRVLFSPLDWGLGHTTRSLPLIHALREEEVELVFAGSSRQQDWVKAYFPDMEVMDLPGHTVRYARSAVGMLPRLILQLPSFWNQVKKEREWLAEQQRLRPFDGVISDNRYGLWHPDAESVFITHQLQIQTPWGGTSWIRRAQFRMIRPFDQIWVVDHEGGGPSLAGALAHPPGLPPGTRYIGWLSAMDPGGVEENRQRPLLILLSGPEPQRTLLSDRLWKQVQEREWDRPIWFVEGSPQAPHRNPSSPRVMHWTHLQAGELNRKLAESAMVICRSGYSTIMDLIRMGKPAILVPTPGQTEQEYLGRRLGGLSWFTVCSQEGFRLDLALKAPLRKWPEQLSDPGHFLRHRTVVREWVQSLRQRKEGIRQRRIRPLILRR